VHNTGFWFLDEEANWQPSKELLAFLDGGAPPIYVGFGSIGNPAEAERTTHLIIDALKRSGQRGLLATGWNGLSKLEQLPKNIFILESAPHAWLFPRMAAVVHHGGAGTTAAGLRAGVPNIIIPHGNDQFAWGRRVFEMGVGPRPIPRKKITVEKLSNAIESALTPQVREAAMRLGQNIQTERGAESAAAIIMSALQ
jgi:sterol 3beta-glucosyltransferase